MASFKTESEPICGSRKNERFCDRLFQRVSPAVPKALAATDAIVAVDIDTIDQPGDGSAPSRLRPQDCLRTSRVFRLSE